MRTILFIFFLLLLWCGFSSFESTSVRPNGWYYVIDMEHDSLSADPIVTVKDFARIKLDSVSDSPPLLLGASKHNESLRQNIPLQGF